MLLDDLTQLLELGVIPKEIEVSKSASAGRATSSRARGVCTTSAAATTTASTTLRSQIEQVYTAIAFAVAASRGCRGGSWGRRWYLLLLLLWGL